MAAMSFLTIGVWFSLNNQIQKNKHAQGLCQDQELQKKIMFTIILPHFMITITYFRSSIRSIRPTLGLI